LKYMPQTLTYMHQKIEGGIDKLVLDEQTSALHRLRYVICNDQLNPPSKEAIYPSKTSV
jgi:hypothetical protein